MGCRARSCSASTTHGGAAKSMSAIHSGATSAAPNFRTRPSSFVAWLPRRSMGWSKSKLMGGHAQPAWWQVDRLVRSGGLWRARTLSPGPSPGGRGEQGGGPFDSRPPPPQRHLGQGVLELASRLAYHERHRARFAQPLEVRAEDRVEAVQRGVALAVLLEAAQQSRGRGGPAQQGVGGGNHKAAAGIQPLWIASRNCAGL